MMTTQGGGQSPLERAQKALRDLQDGAAVALAIAPEDGPVADFLAAIHRTAVRGLLASDGVTNEAAALSRLKSGTGGGE